MKKLLKNKEFVALLLVLGAAIVSFATVLVCDHISEYRTIGAARVNYYLYEGVKDYDYLQKNLGDVISEEDYNYRIEHKNSGGHIMEISVTQEPDGSIMVIQYRESNELLGGYEIHSVKVFWPDEVDEFVAYMYGTQE